MNFHTAGFTNFTRDHLDYHHTMEAYFDAKQLLFMPRRVSSPLCGFEWDDEAVDRARDLIETSLWYGVNEDGPGRLREYSDTWVAIGIEFSLTACAFVVVAGEGGSVSNRRLVGRINVYNILLACSVALTHGLSDNRFRRDWQSCG